MFTSAYNDNNLFLIYSNKQNRKKNDIVASHSVK
jgi:hypothetical protein